MSVAGIAPVGAPLAGEMLALRLDAIPGGPAPSSSFSQLLMDGIDQANRKLAASDAMVRTFVLDNSVPLHQVTYALEEARLSLELMLQVRTQLVEGYRRVMDMQL